MRRQVVVALAVLVCSIGAARAQTVYLAFGDSITFGIGETDETEMGYPTRLEPLLVAGGIVDPAVENYGQPGEETPGGLSRIDSVLDEGGDFILIMEGSNDIRNAEISTESVAFNLGKMVDKAQEAGVIPILASIIPLRPSANTTEDFELAKLLRQEALSEGIDLADNYAVFDLFPNAWPDLYNTERQPDNVGHPNADGYDVLAQSFADILLGNDTLPPVLGDVTPVDGASDVAKTVTISVILFDQGEGIDTATTTMRINGVAVTAQRSGSKAKSTYTYNSPDPLNGVVLVEMDARDQATPANTAILAATRFSTTGTTFFKGDINSDGRVDGLDLVALAFSFGKSKGDSRYRTENDLDNNNKVDGADLAILANNFGKSSL